MNGTIQTRPFVLQIIILRALSIIYVFAELATALLSSTIVLSSQRSVQNSTVPGASMTQTTPSQTTAANSTTSERPAFYRRPPFYVIALVIIAAAIVVLVFVLASKSHLANTASNRAYAGFSAIMALIALGAALIAVVLAFPSFATWMQNQLGRVDLHVSFEAAATTDDMPVSAENHSLSLPGAGTSFIVKAIVVNRGKVPVKNGIFNFYVPADCKIKALDDPLKQHFSGILPTKESLAASAEPSLARFTSAYDDFLPGTEYIFHACVSVPTPSTYTVKATAVGSAPNGGSNEVADYVRVTCT